MRPVKLSVVSIGVDRLPMDALEEFCTIRRVARQQEVLTLVEVSHIDILIVGPRLKPGEAVALIEACSYKLPDRHTNNIIICAREDLGAFQRLIDSDNVFYIANGVVTTDELVSIIRAAGDLVSSSLIREPSVEKSSSVLAAQLIKIYKNITSDTSVVELLKALAVATESILTADAATCLLYDRSNQVVKSSESIIRQEDHDSVASGLVGFVIRTRETLCANVAERDPRFDVDIDNPLRLQHPRLLVSPILDSRRCVYGVLAAFRDGESLPFTSEDISAIQNLCEWSAPLFQLPNIIDDLDLGDPADAMTVFRQEAVRWKRDSAQDHPGSLLSSPPTWLKWSPLWLLSMLLLAAGLCALVISRPTISGPLVIEARSKVIVSAPTNGTIRSVYVSVGEHVLEGDTLVEYSSTMQATPIERLNSRVLAADTGVASDVLVRPGEFVVAGTHIATIVNESSGYDAIAFIPGQYAPHIHVGNAMTIRLGGYSSFHLRLRVSAVSSGIITQQDAASYLRQEGLDPTLVSGSVVMVNAQLSSRWGFDDNGPFKLFEGLTGRAYISDDVGSRVLTILPGLH